MEFLLRLMRAWVVLTNPLPDAYNKLHEPGYVNGGQHYNVSKVAVNVEEVDLPGSNFRLSINTRKAERITERLLELREREPESYPWITVVFHFKGEVTGFDGHT